MDADNVISCELPMLEGSRFPLVTDGELPVDLWAMPWRCGGDAWAMRQLTRCDVHHSRGPGGDAGLDARA
jgi:hypothetical protein